MLTDSMSPDDIKRELDGEVRELDFRVLNYRTNVLAKAYRKKQVKFPCQRCVSYVSKKNNNILAILNLMSEEDVYSPLFRAIYIYDAGYGKKAVIRSFTGNQIEIIEFGPHFFQRYSERANVEKQGVDLIKHFFLKNISFILQRDYVRDNDCKGPIMYTCDEGACFGDYYGNGAVELKTFLHNSNMKENSYKWKLNEKHNEILENSNKGFLHKDRYKPRKNESNN